MKKKIFMFTPLFLLSVFLCCKQTEGDYSKYLDKAGTVYPGKAVSVEILTGYNRANINSLISPDPRVVKIRVYWNSRRDSIDAAITPNDLAKYKILNITSIPEGVYTFEVVTFDAAGHRSTVTEKTGSVLGPNYISTLVNRVIKSKITSAGSPAVIWYTESDTTSVMAGVQVTYPLNAGGSFQRFTSRSKDTTFLTGAKPGGKLIMKTAYLPKGAIDTFYSKPDTLAY